MENEKGKMEGESMEQSSLQSLIDRWGRYATPDAELQPIRFEQYMAWTPEECNKLEMVEGRLLVGNPEDGTERMLAFLMRAFGLAHTLRLAPASAWRPALAEIDVTVAPGREWSVLPEPPAPSERDPVLARRQAASRLALDVRLRADATGVSGRWLIGPFAVRPAAEAETVLIPDWLYVSSERKDDFQEYYLAGAPDWVLEAPWPGGLAFCREVRLPLYFEGGAQEVWVLDWGGQAAEVYVHAAGKPVLAGRYGSGDRIWSDFFPELSLDVDRVLGEESQLTARDRPGSGRAGWDGPGSDEVDRDRPGSRESEKRKKGNKGEGSVQLGRRARPQPEPQPLDIDHLSAWRPAEWHKLEIVDGQVYMAGTREEVERALALLLANVGLREAAELAPPAHWQAALF